MAEEKLVRVQFYEPDVGYENLWAARLGEDRYRLESIPFFVYGVAFSDVVLAKPDNEGRLLYIRVVERSGNRTLRARSEAFVENSAGMRAIMSQLEALGCSVEQLRSRLLAINVPSHIDLNAVTGLLTAEAVSWEYGYPEEMNKQRPVSR